MQTCFVFAQSLPQSLKVVSEQAYLPVEDVPQKEHNDIFIKSTIDEDSNIARKLDERYFAGRSNHNKAIAGWHWQQPVPQANDLWAVSYTDDYHGTAVGESGVIIRTTDGGENWYIQESGTTADLLGVYFTGEQHGVAVGGSWSEEAGLYGTILTTNDGGQTWESRTSGAPGFAKGAAFWDVSFGDAEIGIAVGTYGIVARTTDGGHTWTENYQMGENWDGNLFSVSMSDVNNGTIVGTGGTVLRTTDGGVNWSTQESGTTNWLYGVSFMNESNGIAVGESGTILNTENAGTNWYTISVSALTEDLIDVSFTDMDNVLIVGAYNTVARISDGLTRITTYSSMASDSYFDWFLGASLNTIVGTNGQIYCTKDDGDSWETQQKGAVDRLRGVSFINPYIGTVVGHNGLIMHTNDGGDTWLYQYYDSPTPQYKSIKAVSFIDQNKGFAAVGTSYTDGCGHWCPGHILRTNNGGSFWDVSYYSGQDRAFNGITFLDANSVIAVGVYKITENDDDIERPGWCKSTDGGDNWSSWYFPGLEGPFTDVAFSDDQNGVIVGHHGMILHTPDGDSTWTLRESGTTQNLHGVCFADEYHGTAVGDQGTIIYTTDGGLNWEKQTSGTMEHLYSVSFADVHNGMISGRNGVILRTDNGGASWHLQPSRTHHNLYAITMVDAEKATAAGNYGSILRTDNGGWAKYHLSLGSLPCEAGELYGAGAYFAGVDVEIGVEANAGYEFLNWIDDNGNEITSVSDFIYEMPAADVRLFANFQNVTANPKLEPVSEISVFPIPASKTLTVESDYEIFEIQLFDYMGNRQMIIQKPDKRYEIDISGLKTGIYFLQILVENKVLTKRVLVLK